MRKLENILTAILDQTSLDNDKTEISIVFGRE